MMNPAPKRLSLSAEHRQVMLDHTLACLPEEACGLLGGRLVDDGDIVHVERTLLVENELHSRIRFRMAPSEQLRAFQALEADGLELVGFFHSHPKGPSHPSPTDLAEFAYPGVLSLILFPSPLGAWRMRAFAINGVYAPDLSYLEVIVDGHGP